MIRQKVFVDEQGFRDEFDDIDDTAIHPVLFNDDDMPVGTCRVFKDEKSGVYTLGRVAVIKEYRGNNYGKMLVEAAEKLVREAGGKELQLHAQCRITEFYDKIGYTSFGDVEYEQDCPHIRMKKEF